MPGPSRTIQVPFHVGPGGSIAYTIDRVEQAAQELLSVAATMKGERVMRPEYGTPLAALLFEANDPLVQADVKAVMANAFNMLAPKITVTAIDVVAANPQEGIAEFRVSFMLPGDTLSRVAIISVGGSVADYVV